ncbi:MAG: hypothetical protein KDB90_18740, partial [Planctomycetes bacterium]|nr:hypothetical protein [Planctomycetota bacterium]
LSLTDTDSTAITIASVNDAPSGTSATVSATEDVPYVFSRSDFGFSDVDGDAFQRVWITTLPGQGSLLYNGVTFPANNWIDAGDLDLGLLTFEAAPDASGTAYASFTFQVQDDGGTANGGVNKDPTPDTLTIDVAAANDAPTISSLSGDSASYAGGDGAVVIEQGGDALVADVDSADFDTGTLTVSFVAGSDSSED